MPANRGRLRRPIRRSGAGSSVREGAERPCQVVRGRSTPQYREATGRNAKLGQPDLPTAPGGLTIRAPLEVRPQTRCECVPFGRERRLPGACPGVGGVVVMGRSTWFVRGVDVHEDHVEEPHLVA